jgi:hypothetical protein
MATTITRTIGNGTRDYTSINTWASDCPVDLVAVDQIWQGLLYREGAGTNGEWTGSGITLGSGKTTGINNYIELRAAPGESIRDNTSNPMRASSGSSLGVSIANTGNPSVSLAAPYTRIVGIIVRGPYGQTPLGVAGGATASLIDSCLIQSSGGGAGGGPFVNSGSTMMNTLVVCSNTNGQGGVGNGTSNNKIVNCTIVKTVTPAGGGITMGGGVTGILIRNCAVFGFTTFAGAGSDAASGFNCTDLGSAAGSNNQTSKTFANQFVNTGATLANADFRLITGADCIDNGTTDTTNVPGSVDMYGQTRPSGSAWDIGAFEFQQGGGGGGGILLSGRSMSGGFRGLGGGFQG